MTPRTLLVALSYLRYSDGRGGTDASLSHQPPLLVLRAFVVPRPLVGRLDVSLLLPRPRPPPLPDRRAPGGIVAFTSTAWQAETGAKSGLHCPFGTDRDMWKSYVEIQKEEKESFLWGRWISPSIPNQTMRPGRLRRAESMLFPPLAPLDRASMTEQTRSRQKLWDEKWSFFLRGTKNGF